MYGVHHFHKDDVVPLAGSARYQAFAPRYKPNKMISKVIWSKYTEIKCASLGKRKRKKTDINAIYRSCELQSEIIERVCGKHEEAQVKHNG